MLIISVGVPASQGEEAFGRRRVYEFSAPGWAMTVCESDLRVGGTFRHVWRNTDETEMAMRGVYREITPPKRLVSTESWGGDWPETLNTLVLTEEDGKATMTCTVLYASQKSRDAALGTGMKEGWSASYERLDKYLRRMA